eukprot:TRINITY_DN3301_c0_g1_i3.p1 TRINITY_DN3301_c0_g1~~TRINITY_DN3301_c0_g1_i3.p1  ORF type:complete len:141 (-),score=7.21 TRINITY_DN3301_c0_g1_i3:256-678(-)
MGTKSCLLFNSLLLLVLIEFSSAATYVYLWNRNVHYDSEVISVGDTAIWNSTDGLSHTVQFLSKSPSNASEVVDSPTFRSSLYSITFVTPGNYSYQCSIHGSDIFFFLPFFYFSISILFVFYYAFGFIGQCLERRTTHSL